MVPLAPAALAEEEQEEDVMIAALPTTEGRVSLGDATSAEAEGDDDNDEFLPSRRGTWDLLDAAATPAVATPAVATPAPTTLAAALATVTAGETPEYASGNSFCPPPLAAAALEFLDEGNGISMEAEPSPAAAAAAVAAAVVEVVVAVSGGD